MFWGVDELLSDMIRGSPKAIACWATADYEARGARSKLAQAVVSFHREIRLRIIEWPGTKARPARRRRLGVACSAEELPPLQYHARHCRCDVHSTGVILSFEEVMSGIGRHNLSIQQRLVTLSAGQAEPETRRTPSRDQWTTILIRHPDLA